MAGRSGHQRSKDSPTATRWAATTAEMSASRSRWDAPRAEHFTYSTTILYGIRKLDGTIATGLARTFRLGLNRTVRDKKLGKETGGNEIGCFLHTRAKVRDKKTGKAIF